MRTTLTLDRDVAAMIERARAGRDAALKQVINDALRLGLAQMMKPAHERRRPYRIKTFPGRSKLASMDNIADVLSVVESEDHR